MIRIKPNYIKIKSHDGGELRQMLAIKGDKGDKGDKGTGASVVSTEFIGMDESGGNTFRITFDDGSYAEFVAPKGEKGESEAVDYLSVYPIGAVYLSVNDTSPASLFGGEWERLKDRFLLGAGDTYAAGNTGGSADAVIAEHDHFIFGRDAGATTTDYVSGRCYVTTYVSTGDRPYTLKQSANQTDQPINGVTSKTGVSGVGKNMPPYLAVYMWKRTA